jgi:uncharacterized protein (AIM24 family)
MDKKSIGYKVFVYQGGMQIIELELDPEHRISARSVFDKWIDEGLSYEKEVPENGRLSPGVFEKLWNSGKTKLNRKPDSLIYFTNPGGTRKRVAFAAPPVRQILPIHLSRNDGIFLCHKEAFICTNPGIEVVSMPDSRLVSNLLNSKKSEWLSFFGDGVIFVHVGGVFKNKKLQNQNIALDQRSIIGLTEGLTYERANGAGITANRSNTRAYFRGKLSGTGTVYLQSRPHKLPKRTPSLTRDIQELANAKAQQLYNGNLQKIKNFKWSKLPELVKINRLRNCLKTKINLPDMPKRRVDK